MALTDYMTAKPLAFGILDQLKSCDEETVTVVPYTSSLGTGSLSLLAEIGDHPAVSTVHLAVRDLEQLSETLQHLRPRIAELDVELSTVEIDSLRFASTLAESSLLFLCNQYDIPNYRFFSSRNKRDVIRIHHGILTKAYGNLTAANLRKQSNRRRKTLQYPSAQKYIENINIDIQSVESATELFFRATAEGRSPTVFQRYGYPRFDRIRKLLDERREPLVPESTAEQLSDETTRILYAPTHKDNAYQTTLFPFPDFDIDRLRETLRRNEIELYVRMHFSEDQNKFYERIVDDETVFRAGQAFSPSPTEVLPFFDTLITDYSSIYIDYLPVDNPIIFLKDDHESFLDNRGIAFDYDDYFPGRKIETFEEFRQHLTQCVESRTDGYEADREFVRRTFLPERDQTFLEQIIENHLNTG